MRRILILALMLLMLAGGTALSEIRAIRDWRFEGTLHADNTVSVKEVLTVELSAGSHGIERLIPEQFTLDGKTYGTMTRDIRVDSGEPWKLAVDGDALNIRIGDAKAVVEGEHTYELSYTYVMPEDGLADGDFLYYSMLGDDVGSTIDHFSFRLDFEKPLSKDTVEGMELYSGPAGSTSDALNVNWIIDEHGVSGTVQDVKHGQAVTLYGKLPEGYFEGAMGSGALRRARALQKLALPNSRIIGIAIVLLVALLAAVLVLRRRCPHQREGEPELQRFPPEGIDSAQAAYLLTYDIVKRGAFSLVMDWAFKGIVSISTNEEGHAIATKQCELPDDAPEHQKKLFGDMFFGSTPFDFTDKAVRFSYALEHAREAVGKGFTGARSLVWHEMLFINICVLNGLLNGLLVGGASESVWLGLFSAVLCGFCSAFGYMLYVHPRGKGARLFPSEIPIYLFFNAFNIILDAVFLWNRLAAPQWWMLICGFALNVAIPILARKIESESQYMFDTWWHLKGYEAFLSRMSSEDMEQLEAEHPGYLAQAVPYAVAFGLINSQSDPILTGYANTLKSSDDPAIRKAALAGAITGQLLYDTLKRMREPSKQEENQRRQAEAAAQRSRSSGRDFSGSSSGRSGGGGGGGGVRGW